jgi:hypothetical protein
MKNECERCGEVFEHLFLSVEGYVCHDCMSDLDDEQFEDE